MMKLLNTMLGTILSLACRLFPAIQVIVEKLQGFNS